MKVMYWDVPAGAISRFENDQWDGVTVLTADTVSGQWVPAHVSQDRHIWLQSGNELGVPLTWLPSSGRNPHEAYDKLMQGAFRKIQALFIESVERIVPKVYDGTLGVIHRGSTWGTGGFHVTFGLGFTRGNAFDEPPWFRPTERWCPKELQLGPPPYCRTIWERLGD
jgi:hypothetical protein